MTTGTRKADGRGVLATSNATVTSNQRLGVPAARRRGRTVATTRATGHPNRKAAMMGCSPSTVTPRPA